MARVRIMNRSTSNSLESDAWFRSTGVLSRPNSGWHAFWLLLVVALVGCGGSDSDSGPTYQPLPTFTEDKLPEGARVDLGAFAQQPIHAGNEWGYDRRVDAVVSGAVTLSVTAGPATDGLFAMTETDSTDASLNRTLAYRQTEAGLVRIDPFDAKLRYPGLFAALPEVLEYPAQAYPIGSVRRHLRQGNLKIDIDGDGYEDFYRAEFTQTFKGYQQLTVLGQANRVARFANTTSLTLKTTSDNKSQTRIFSEDTYFAEGVGLVRSDRVTKDGDGAILVPAYRLELSNATVGDRVLPSGLLWKFRDSGTHRTLLGIVSSGAQAVAVGGLGTIISSSDGKAWTTRQSGVGVHLNGVATSGSLFVAVGDLGTIVTSKDAATWASQTSGTSNNLRGVAWTGSQFVAVGDSGTILNSADGAAWTVRTSSTVANLYAVAGHAKQIVAVGASSTVLTSPTGEAWTARASSCCETLSGIVWSGTQFLAVGSGWWSSSASWQTSDDGIAWMPRGNCCIGFRAVTWSGAHFVAVGDNYSISSADGIASSTSSAFAGTLGSSSLYAVAWHVGEFLAVGADGAIFAASPRAADVPSLYGIATSSSAVVAVGAQGRILSSADGTTWTSRSSGVTTTLRSVARSGSTFVTVGDKGTILSSSDAATWVSRSSGTSNHLRGITWTGAQFVAVGNAGTILVSPEGATWTAQTSPTTSNLVGIAGNAVRIAAISEQSTVLTSSDGAAWAESPSPGGMQLGGVLWSGTQFVVFGAQSTSSVFTSYDGLHWTERRTNMGNPMYGGGASDSGIVLVGQFGLILTSADGIAWVSSSGVMGGQDLYAAAWFGGRTIVAGQGRIGPLP